MMGVVLAGGKSSRMLQPKALLQHPFHPQQTLLDYAIELLLDVGCSKVIVSGEEFGGVKDLFPEKGPLSGIFSAIKDCCSEQFLIIPVDMPLMDVALLEELIEYAGDVGSCSFFESQFPLILHKTPQAMEYLDSVLQEDNSDRSIMAFLRFIEARTTRCSHPEKLMNTNTPQEWLSIHR